MTDEEAIAEQLAAEKLLNESPAEETKPPRKPMTPEEKSARLAEGRAARAIRLRLAKGDTTVTSDEIARLDRYNAVKSPQGRKPKVLVPSGGAVDPRLPVSSTDKTPTTAPPAEATPNQPDLKPPGPVDIRPKTAEQKATEEKEKATKAMAIAMTKVALNGAADMYRDWLKDVCKELRDEGEKFIPPDKMIDGLFYPCAKRTEQRIGDWLTAQGVSGEAFDAVVTTVPVGYVYWKKRKVRKRKEAKPASPVGGNAVADKGEVANPGQKRPDETAPAPTQEKKEVNNVVPIVKPNQE